MPIILLSYSGAECGEHTEADRAYHQQRQEAGGALHLGHYAGLQVRHHGIFPKFII